MVSTHRVARPPLSDLGWPNSEVAESTPTILSTQMLFKNFRVMHCGVVRGGAGGSRGGTCPPSTSKKVYYSCMIENLLDALFVHSQLQNQGQLKPNRQTSGANFSCSLWECRLKFCLNSRFRLEENGGRRWRRLEKRDAFKHTVLIKLSLDCLWAMYCLNFFLFFFFFLIFFFLFFFFL